MGSPPLARGVPIIVPNLETATRITPACAGSTGYSFDTISVVGDHPRLRGEYWLITFTAALVKGSPPLARGVHDIL